MSPAAALPVALVVGALPVPPRPALPVARVVGHAPGVGQDGGDSAVGVLRLRESAYCTVIDACSELLDVARCRSWSESFVRWCETQQELVLYRGHCFLHRAEVLGLLGAWPQALDEARHACDRLAAPIHPSALGAACAIEGHLLRLLGDFSGAEASYQRASEHGHDPQPGLALLRLAQGRVDVADAAIRRALGETADPMARARLLGLYVEIMLAAGDEPAARVAADEFGEVAAG